MSDQYNIEDLFSKAANQPTVASFGETKELFLTTVPTGSYTSKSKPPRILTLKNGLIMLVIASIIFGVWMFIPQEVKQTIKEPDQIDQKSETYFGDSLKNDHQEGSIVGLKEVQSEQIESTVMDEGETQDSTIVEFNRDTNTSLREHTTSHNRPSNLDEPFKFPKLTEEEIAANNKRKKKLIKDLSKPNKSKLMYYIPPGSISYQGKPVSVKAFFMQGTEVTNIQYKTFLFDLLIQDRKDDFILAAPDQSLWTKEFGAKMQSFQDNYFSGEKYENYSVNNISREGAELFCNWLTKEINEHNKEKGLSLIKDVRLPQRVEWVYAASELGKFKTYSWGSDSLILRSKKGKRYFAGNFKLDSYKGNLRDYKNDSTKNYFSHLGDSNSISTNAFMFGDVAPIAATFMQGANAYGLKAMCGNVAEMVYDEDEPGTAGGGWMSNAEDLKLEADDPHRGERDPNLNIGFRVIISH